MFCVDDTSEKEYNIRGSKHAHDNITRCRFCIFCDLLTWYACMEPEYPLHHKVHACHIPYSRKYWRSLNLAVWSQAAKIKILAELNLAVALRSVICHSHCERVYQRALPSSCLRYLNKAVSSQIYKKYNWQHVNNELAIRTACEKGAPDGAKSATACIMSYALRAQPT